MITILFSRNSRDMTTKIKNKANKNCFSSGWVIINYDMEQCKKPISEFSGELCCWVADKHRFLQDSALICKFYPVY